MKGVYRHNKLSEGTFSDQGYTKISPCFWIQKDPFVSCHKYIDLRSGREYWIFIRGDYDECLMESIKEYISGKAHSLASLKGRWLIVIYGQSQQNTHPEITLISDRLASHRLYYAYDGRTFIWSTNLPELFALRRQLNQDVGLDISGLNGYLNFLHQPASKTIVEGINTLVPASSLILSESKLTISKYLSFEFQSPLTSQKKAVSEIKHLFDEVISPQILASDEKIGLFLSGGLDSSLLAGICQKAGRNPVTYTVGFDGEDDEREEARAVAEHFKTQHREVVIRPEDVPDLMWEVTRSLGFPTGNPSSLATYAVAKQARKEVGRLFSGLGSDEIFAGHTKHILARYWPVARPAVSFIRGNFFPFGGQNSSGLLGRPAKISHYQDLYTFFDHHQLHKLLLPEYRSTENSFYSNLHRDIFQEEQFLTDVYAWLADDLLPLATNLVAHQGLRLDVPFCADELLDCAARIPLKMKVKGQKGKVVLRKAGQDLVPSRVLEKKRQGFTLPIGRWLKGPLSGFLNTYLGRSVIEKRGIFNADEVQKMIKAHLESKADLSCQLWGLITLEAWQRIFLDAESLK